MSEAPKTAPSPMQQPATWDAVASGYALEAVPMMQAFVEEALRRVELAPTDRVLDVAAGPGTLSFVAAGRAAHVMAVDFSPGMIAEVTARAKREGNGRIEGAVMDAQALSLPDASFDAAFCLFGFMFFPERARAFRELKRVLKPGGRALIATWAPIERRPLLQVGLEALAEALPELPPLPKGDLQSVDECVREMTDAGFRDVAAESFTASAWIESAERYVLFMERSGAPCAALKKKLGEAAWGTVMTRLIDAVGRRVPQGGAELAAEAIFTSGTR